MLYQFISIGLVGGACVSVLYANLTLASAMFVTSGLFAIADAILRKKP